ncbi:class I SAM-dependent methyltransferase [Sneathiella marina]|uniref:Class I SAM-dependent methyltransferase n=1 Tax=Sneathiella marina TaxID=2950108 RepID=A0ABY4W162_9PROT|nr:class I SAM-dependent methyltransferase [Sneathiella marina]USG60813.1 class I SAM-dependent methyltransferase [Sneathiella marina]
MAKGRGRRDKAVRRQYEEYPYPPRDPADEHSRLIEGSPSHLDELNHYLFSGNRDFSKPFRALVAGGGTGDAAIMLAQHLSDRSDQGTVTYLDLSSASRTIAEGRAKARGLTNMEFHTGSLLDLPDMGYAPFDYIDCCGVLHHLEEPERGLQALDSCLAENGGLGLMVYATLGRTGVYPVQNALKLMIGEKTQSEQVKMAKELINSLPESNWLNKNKYLSDHKLGEDAALFDLLLHPRDRSYLVPELLSMLLDCQIELVGFIEPIRYRPETYLKNDLLLKPVKGMDEGDKAALAENICGSLKTHTFYAKKSSNTAKTVAKFNPEMIPILKDKNPDLLVKALSAQSKLNVGFDGESHSFNVPEGAAEFVAVIDGQRSLSEIQSHFSLNWQNFRNRYAATYTLLNGLNLLWLRSS